MHRLDNTCFILFIEPKKEEKLEIPLDDELSQIMKVALNEAKRGSSNYSRVNEIPYFFVGHGYKGYHSTDCGTQGLTNKTTVFI